MSEAWVGIDVSNATLDVVLVRSTDQQHTQLSNDKAGFRTLHHFLEKRCRNNAHVCLEATGLYGDGIAAFLYRQGYQLSEGWS
jgi:transposase